MRRGRISRGGVDRRRASGVPALSVLAASAALVVSACAPDAGLTGFPHLGSSSVVTIVAPDVVGPLRMRGTDLVDGAGRIVLLHGMNSVNKSAPFISLLDDGSLGPADRAYLVGNGFNAVRLGVAYSALMPEPGAIDDGYLDRVVAVVDALSADGLWVQLDFHQDVFHMMPDWATPPDALTLSADPPELLAFIGWAAAYTSPRSLRQWDSFLAGERSVEMPGDQPPRSVASLLGDAAAALAGRVADRDHVIGIELLNEPFSGSAFPRCILSGCGDVDGLLADRYAEMTGAIRAVAPEMPVWEEPFAPTGYAAYASLPPRAVPPASDGAQVGVAWHLYCHDTDGGKVEQAPTATQAWCRQRFANGFDNGAGLSNVLGAPRILNEFGASQNPLDVTIATKAADDDLVSWMYWHLQSRVDGLDSPLPDAVESQIVRPYPQATAGRPRALSFDPTSGRMEYRFTPDPSVEASTSIVIPGRHYPEGYQVVVTHGSVTSAAQSGRLTIAADGSGVDVTVTVTRS